MPGPLQRPRRTNTLQNAPSHLPKVHLTPNEPFGVIKGIQNLLLPGRSISKRHMATGRFLVPIKLDPNVVAQCARNLSPASRAAAAETSVLQLKGSLWAWESMFGFNALGHLKLPLVHFHKIVPLYDAKEAATAQDLTVYWNPDQKTVTFSPNRRGEPVHRSMYWLPADLKVGPGENLDPCVVWPKVWITDQQWKDAQDLREAMQKRRNAPAQPTPKHNVALGSHRPISAVPKGTSTAAPAPRRSPRHSVPAGSSPNSKNN